MQADITISGTAAERLRTMPGLLRQALMGAALGIAQRAASDLRNDDDIPEWTGNLKDGMRPIPTADGAMLLIEAEYAHWVHDGRKAGSWPNIDNLADWAKDHGMPGAEWLIARKIARTGIPGKPFLQRYMSSMQFDQMVRSVLRDEVTHALA